MPHPQVVWERDPAGYRRLLLSAPRRRNALDPAMVRALIAAFAEDALAPVVLASADPRAFCAGADLTLDDAGRSVVSDLLYECLEIMITRPGPVIAVLDGPAVGGGAQLAGAADLRIAGPAARLRWTGPPGRDLAVGAWLLPDLVGRGAALDLTLTGRWVEAPEALSLGLVNRVDGDPGRVAAGLAAALARRGPGGPEAIKLVAAAGGLLDRLRAERDANRAAWAKVIGAGGG